GCNAPLSARRAHARSAHRRDSPDRRVHPAPREPRFSPTLWRGASVPAPCARTRGARASRSPARAVIAPCVASLVRGRRAASGTRHGYADRSANLRFDLRGELRVLLEVIARVVLALPDAIAVVGIPGARLFDHVVGNAQLDHLAFARDAFAVEDVEQRLPEGWRHLVLDDLHARYPQRDRKDRKSTRLNSS